MAQDTPSRKLDQYIVRFPDGMRDTLKEAAKRNKRSLNAEIVARLDESIGREEANAGLDMLSPSSASELSPFDLEMGDAITKAIRQVMRTHGLKPREVDAEGNIGEAEE